MRARRTLAALCALLMVGLLGACGGGGGSSAASTAASKPPPRAGATPAQLEAERKAAGRAAAFVLAGADNSVPTFGAEADATERGAAEGSLEHYLSEREDEDWPRACRALAEPVREGFEKLAHGSSEASACARVLAASSKVLDLTNPLIGHLLSLRIEGQNSFALFYGPGRQKYIVPMLSEGGVWKPTQQAPIAYPPGATR